MGRFPVLIAVPAGAEAARVGNAGAYCVHREGLSSKTVSEQQAEPLQRGDRTSQTRSAVPRMRRGILPSECEGLTINW